MNYELVFTAFNRTDYFQETINSWNNVRNLNSWPTTVHLEPSEVQDQMKDIALNLISPTQVLTNIERAGVLTNPWDALNGAFERGADFVVLAEDDVLVSQDILEFFEWTAIEYQTAYSVLAINAFSRLDTGANVPSGQLTTEDAKFSPLVWGTWRNRWYEYLRDTWDKDYSSGNEDGSEAGWDWNINRILANEGMTIVKPILSRSDHIGEYAGMHMTPDLYPESRGKGFSQIRGRSRYIEI